MAAVCKQDSIEDERELTQEVQGIVDVVDQMGKHCEQEELLRDIFHHKHSTVKKNFEKKMLDLRKVIDESPHANVDRTKQIQSINDAVAYTFLNKEYRTFLGVCLTVSKRVVKKIPSNGEPTPLALELIKLARVMNAHNEYRDIFRVFFEHASDLETLELRSKLTPVGERDKLFDTRTFIETWVGDNYSLYKLLSYLKELRKAQQSDEELRTLFSTWKVWILESSLLCDTDKHKADLVESTDILIENSRKLAISPMYKLIMHHVAIELSFLFSQINKEDNLNELRNRFSELAKGLVLDEEGQPTFKQELFENAGAVAHCVLDSIQHIPLPSIHKKTEKTELRLHDVIINTSDVAPSSLEIKNEDSCIRIRVTNIKAHIRSVRFYFKRFDSRVRSKSVSGIADINIAGSHGMEIEVALAPRILGGSERVFSLFEVQSSTCSISKLKIRLRDTSHDKLYKILSPLINKVATKKLEESIGQYVALYVSKLNSVTTEKTNDAIKQNKVQVVSKQKQSHEEISLVLVSPRNSE